MTLAKIQNASFRRGRGNVTEEVRQFQDEVLSHLNLLRSAMLELQAMVEGDTGEDGVDPDARIVALHSHCDYSGSSGLRYIPWGNTEEASSGGIDVDVALLPPFGSRTIVATARLWCESNAGNTTVTVRDLSGGVLETANIPSMSSGTMHTVTLGYEWTDNIPKLIGVDTTTSPQSLSVLLTLTEAPLA